jgi:hypothetical protein
MRGSHVMGNIGERPCQRNVNGPRLTYKLLIWFGGAGGSACVFEGRQEFFSLHPTAGRINI